MQSVFRALAAFILACCATSAPAQSDYPTKPIVLVVPSAPGGLIDTVARPVAEAMGKALGQPMIVENRGGAGGGIGNAHVARSAPDGYSLLMTVPSVSTIPLTDRISGKPSTYQVDQLTAVARFTADPAVLVVRADSPWKSLADFVADARKREISYGSSGTYGTLHIFMEAFRNAAGLNLLHVPYTGAGPALIALLGGQIQALPASPASVQQYVKSGRLRVLAHWGTGRLPAMPDVPSLTEAGYPVQFDQWLGLFVPKGVPAPIMEKLRAAASKAAGDQKVRRIVEGTGVPVMYLDGKAFDDYWASDARKLTQVVEKIGKVE